MKKILILNGSPKAEKSDTMHLTRAFVSGMQETGAWEAETIHVIQKHIAYCTGCFACMRNGGTCIHKDDMKEILEKILDSHLLIVSFPLYCYGMPAPLKALIDRVLPLNSMAMRRAGDHYEHVEQADFSHLKYVMISGCGFPNQNNNFEPAVLQFRRMFGEDSTVLTVPESPMFNAPEAAAVTVPYLNLVKEAGREYGRQGTISPKTMAALSVPMIPEEVYVNIVNQGL